MRAEEFAVGMRVMTTVDEPDGNEHIYAGLTGTVVGHECGWINVCWDAYVDGHDCRGLCERGYGWNVKSTDIEPYFDDKEISEADIPEEPDLLGFIGIT